MKIIDGIATCKDNCSIGEYIILKFSIPDLSSDAKVKINNPYKVGELNKDGLMLTKDYYVDANMLVFEFVAYKAGDFNIAPMDVYVNELEYITQGYDFTVQSLGENLELKDIVNPLKVYPSFLYYLGVFSFLSIVVVLIILLIKRIKIKTNFVKTPLVSPYEKALRKINQIEFNKELKTNLKNYVTAVSEVVKTFIDEEYLINILDLTTTEFIHKLKIENLFEDEKINLCKNFFKEADLIKFKESINLREDKNFIEEAKKIIYCLKKQNIIEDKEKIK